MKRTTIWIGAAAALAVLAIFSLAACKKAEVETKTLTVIVSEGVSGSPAAGDYTLEVGADQSYAYTLGAGYEKLTVLLDGNAIAASGSFTVSGDHTLRAYSDDNNEYKLIVAVGAGVIGAPAAGTYYYKQGTKVPYSYKLADGYKGLSVKVDGVEAEASGTLTMSEDFVINASAEVKYDIRSTPWKLSESYNDGSSFEVTVTFSGTLTGGTVSDSEGGAGIYEFVDDTVDFNLVFPNVTYVYENGDFADENTMNGTCKRYQTADSAVAGTWTAKRITSGVAGIQSGGSKNKSRN
ncbi:MAG: hypothetical protein MUC72_07975 [Acidobacteria bacterium]|jgi:hypothetical protein|nr:hypothetical protein [Acidobacteriota bacterium]